MKRSNQRKITAMIIALALSMNVLVLPAEIFAEENSVNIEDVDQDQNDTEDHGEEIDVDENEDENDEIDIDDSEEANEIDESNEEDEEDDEETDEESEEEELAEEEAVFEEQFQAESDFSPAVSSIEGFEYYAITENEELERIIEELEGGERIEFHLLNDIELEEKLYLLEVSNIELLFRADSETTIYQNQDGAGHFIFEDAHDITLSFENIILEGGTDSGGIEMYISTDIIINEPVIMNAVYEYGEGGAIRVSEGTAVINGGKLMGNQGFRGGAIAGIDGSRVVIDGTQIINNLSHSSTASSSDSYNSVGGGISIENHSELILRNAVVSNNEVTAVRAAVLGGGIYVGETSTAEITNTVISANTAYKDSTSAGAYGFGGGIYVSNTGSVEFGNNVVIGGDSEEEGNFSNQGGGIYYEGNNSNTLVLGSGVAVKSNVVMRPTGAGGGVNIGSNNTLVIDGAEIMHNAAYDLNNDTSYGNGGGVYGYTNTYITMNSGKINENKAVAYGSGVYIYDQSTFVMEDGEINGNTGARFGGTAIYGKTAVSYGKEWDIATIYINGGEIRFNESERSVGTVSGGNVIMSDGVISDNHIDLGHSSAISGRYVTIGGGEIINNHVGDMSTYYGTTVTADTFIMTDGLISGNTVDIESDVINKAEGTVHVESGAWWIPSKVNITGGEISNNVAGYGGALYHIPDYDEDRDFDCFTSIHDAVFENNEAVFDGGALYLVDTPVDIGGDTLFKGNTAQNGGAVYYTVDEGFFDTEEEYLFIDGEVQFKENKAIKNGGAIYMENLENLYIEEDVTFGGNKAENAYLISDEAHIELHEMQVLATVFSSNFEFGYNDFDILYTDGTIVDVDGGEDNNGDGDGDNGEDNNGDGDGDNNGEDNNGGSDGDNNGEDSEDRGSGGGTSVSVKPAPVFEEAQAVFNPILTDRHVWYVTGYPDSTFRADTAITRAEIAVIFYNLIEDDYKAESYSTNYTDVAEGTWYYQAVSYLQVNNIMQGYPDGTFRPDAYITRAELATVCSIFFEMEEGSYPFTDMTSGHWAHEYVANAYVKGWIAGYPDNTFRPDESTSRAEAVKMLNSILGRRLHGEDVPEGANKYTDINETHWAYADIIEASYAHEFTMTEDNRETWTDFSGELY